MMVPTWPRRDGTLWRDDSWRCAPAVAPHATRCYGCRAPRRLEGAFGYFSVDPMGAPVYGHFYG